MESIKASDLEEPLDRDAAALMAKDITEYEKVVQETIRGKSYFNRNFDNVYFMPKKKWMISSKNHQNYNSINII